MTFSTATFKFLRELEANNRRDWFTANKERFLRDARDPMLEFISDFAPRLKKISAHFVADPAPTGGSMFRIYRDTRFSKDKSPYKTHLAAHFQHVSGCGSKREDTVHAPGFYLHIARGESFVGAGLWRPEPALANKIRQSIVAKPKQWQSAVKGLELDGDSLARPPRGFPPDHPLIDDLRRKDFICGEKFSERDICSPKFVDTFAQACRRAAPLVKFLTEAVGLKF
jgi:uncharacterized protein (TIGR02453 family)